MSLERLYQKYAGTAETTAPAAKWPYGPDSEPPQSQSETRMVVGAGPGGPDGPGKIKRQEQKTLATPLATGQEVETILANLHSMGHDLGEVEPLARTVMRNLTRAAAAELAAVLDDLFQTAPSADVARSQCHRVLSDPQALDAARACWPNLASLPHASTSTPATSAPVVDHAPRWLRYIRAHCPLVPEDETHLRRYLGNQAPDAVMGAAQRYVTTWQQAAKAEPRQAARDNAGRRAANTALRGGNHAG
ncbi:hypothetical protein QC823_15860 [Halomonas vilamensis]|uniref:Uncharacterized protein n=1 Tax=Vreelandella vilamensis TaxID=531309 RepID=A0ABU1H812_9GAMM|nr:hypothetical protein [Halomonas vilamensis]MDR5900439.1 hypothetical protein [Halomonas vilamensis]